MITYIVRKNTEMLCGNCRLRLPRLSSICPFCGGIFSNFQIILRELFHDYEVGHLTYDEICDIILLEERESEEILDASDKKECF